MSPSNLGSYVTELQTLIGLLCHLNLNVGPSLSIDVSIFADIFICALNEKKMFLNS